MKTIILKGVYIFSACLVTILSMHFTFTQACCSECKFSYEITNSENCCITANETTCCEVEVHCCEETDISSCNKKTTNVHFEFETITASLFELQPKIIYLLDLKNSAKNLLVCTKKFISEIFKSKYLPNHHKISKLQVFLI
ncbi:MAG: hypothetical protein CMD25_01110 [Flavobacteriales bacterium]|mgnify:CR=1 FL=1|nr:hypothetical protein [Flavobacteriales bacterium]